MAVALAIGSINVSLARIVTSLIHSIYVTAKEIETDGGEVRPVMYRASLSEMVVPYGDPNPQMWENTTLGN